MTTTPTTVRRLRFALVALLLGAGLLIASAQPGSAGERAATAAQMQDSGQSDLTLAPASSGSAQDLCPTGAGGFGWG